MLENLKYFSLKRAEKIKDSNVFLRLDLNFWDYYQKEYLDFIKLLLKNHNTLFFIVSFDKDLNSLRRFKKFLDKNFKAKKSKILKDILNWQKYNEKYQIFLFHLEDDLEFKLSSDFAKNLSTFVDYYFLLSVSLLDEYRSSLDILANFKTIYYTDNFKFYLKEIEKFRKNLFPKDSLILLGGKINYYLLEHLNRLTMYFDTILLSANWAYYLWSLKKQDNIHAFEKKILNWEKKYSNKILYPLDYVVLSYNAKKASYKLELKKLIDIKSRDFIIDIGPETIRYYSLLFREHQYLLYNNTLSLYPNFHYSHSDKILARAFANRSKGKAYGIILSNDLMKLFAENDLLDWVDLAINSETAFYKVLYHYLISKK